MTVEHGATPRLRVLAADDHRDTADSLALMVRLWGHDCDVAYDGIAAFRMFEERAHHVVIVDIVMPGLSGFDVAQSIIRKSGPRPLLVAISGLTSLQDRRRAAECGFDHFLLKPAEPATIRLLLESARR